MNKLGVFYRVRFINSPLFFFPLWFDRLWILITCECGGRTQSLAYIQRWASSSTRWTAGPIY